MSDGLPLMFVSMLNPERYGADGRYPRLIKHTRKSTTFLELWVIARNTCPIFCPLAFK